MFRKNAHGVIAISLSILLIGGKAEIMFETFTKISFAYHIKFLSLYRSPQSGNEDSFLSCLPTALRASLFLYINSLNTILS